MVCAAMSNVLQWLSITAGDFFFFLLLSSKRTLSILSVHFSSHYNYECCINSMAGDEAVQLASFPKRQEQFVLTWKIGNIQGHGGHSS